MGYKLPDADRSDINERLGLTPTQIRMLALMRDRVSDARIRLALGLDQESALEMSNTLRRMLECRLDETLREAAKRWGIVLPKRWVSR